MREEFNFKESDIVIGHVGRFVEQKNHSFLKNRDFLKKQNNISSSNNKNYFCANIKKR